PDGAGGAAAAQTQDGRVAGREGGRAAALAPPRTGPAGPGARARRDPGNTLWQRDLSVSHDRIGDVLVAQGEREAALDAYRNGLAIAEALARSGPANTRGRGDLSVSPDKIGDGLVAHGERESAH